jgi:hypothetical protein
MMKPTILTSHPDLEKSNPTNPDEPPPEVTNDSEDATCNSTTNSSGRIGETVHDLVEHFKEYARKVDL